MSSLPNTVNPYSNLSLDQLRVVAEARRIQLPNNYQDAIVILQTLDELNPEYLQQVANIRDPPEQITSDKLLLLAGLRGIDIKARPVSNVFYRYLILRIFPNANASVQNVDTVARYLGVNNPELYSTDALKNYISRGIPLPRSRDIIAERRLTQAGALSRLLPRIHNCSDVRCALTRPEHPLEQYLALLRTGRDLDTIRRNLGIIVPFGHDVQQYLEANIADYAQVFNQGQPLNVHALSGRIMGDIGNILSKYTDQQLFDTVGAYVGYNSRQELINGMARLISGEPIFFMPLGDRRCVNPETQLLSETSDPEVRIFAYGTLDQYRCFEPEELDGSFNDYEEGFQFRIPGVPGNFDIEAIESLERLVGRSETLGYLGNKIRRGIQEVQRMQQENPALAAFRQLSATDRALAQEYLEALFRAGMYMRRWTGQGCYPVRANQTRGDIEPAVLSTPELSRLDAIYREASRPLKRFLDSLQVVRIDDVPAGLVRGSLELVKHYVSKVLSGRECIRIASSRFVLSAYYYLQSLFGITIPNFNPLELEPIS